MQMKSLGGFVSHLFSLLFLLVVFFVVLSWLKMPSGAMIDWIVGVVTAWWLYVIVTIPWDVYFEAKGVIDEADQSRAIGISVNETQQIYVQKVRDRALLISIALHLISAAALFALSFFHITPVGYIASIAALLLTALRPSIRAYHYLWERLRAIRQQVKYPREDVVELRQRTRTLEDQVKLLTRQLDVNAHESFAAEQVRAVHELKIKVTALQSTQDRMADDNQRAHEKILREGQLAMTKISADSQFLDNVREIVRLIKSA
jgi:hypothetical protein